MSVQQENSRADRSLWRQVITQALNDARMPGDETSWHGKRVARAAEEAREWLTGNSRDFRMVCNLADLDPERVRSFALATLARDDHAACASPERTAPKSRRKLVLFEGQQVELIELAQRFGVNILTLRSRLASGVPLHDALTRPVGPTGGSSKLSRTHRGPAWGGARNSAPKSGFST